MLMYTAPLLPKLFSSTAVKQGKCRVSQTTEGRKCPRHHAEEKETRNWRKLAVWWLIKKLQPTWQKKGWERFRLIFAESH